VIVCGLHRVGLRIVQQLSLSGVPAVVVDDNPDLRLARNLVTWGVPHIAGSSRAAETLAEAGLAGCAAVVCAEEDDLRTLETALLTRKLRADVRVVVQLTNPAVGRALSQIQVSVLDTAGLAAPSIAEACLGTGQDVWLSGDRFAAVRAAAPRAGSLRELYGDLAPVAVLPAAGGNAEICPGRDHEVAPGDEVTLIGTPEALDGAGLSGGADRPAGPVPAVAARQVRYARQLALSMLRAVDRRLGWTLAALFAVVIVSAALLRVAYQAGGGSGRHLSVLDAVYFTVETVTTVGYGDYSFRDQPAWLIAGATGLMLAGALFVAVFFAMVTNTIVGLRISELLGRQRITGLSGHVLVIGLGSVGMQVVRLPPRERPSWWSRKTSGTGTSGRPGPSACPSSSPTGRSRRRWSRSASQVPPPSRC